MGYCFLHGTGGGPKTVVVPVPEPGTGLNVLFGGERPEAAEENTIWVSTTEGSGAYVLSPDEPEGEEGLVWFQTGDQGLKVTMEGPIKAVFHLLDAYVYLNGSWTYMAEAGVYKDGAWVLFCEGYLMLYDNGTICSENIGGGYDTTGIFFGETFNASPLFWSDRACFLSKKTTQAMMCTKKRLALDRYSKLAVDWHVVDSVPNDPDVTMTLSILDATKQTIVATLPYGPAGARRKDTIDIKDLTGEYYICVYVTACADPAEGQLKGYLYSLDLRV